MLSSLAKLLLDNLDERLSHCLSLFTCGWAPWPAPSLRNTCPGTQNPSGNVLAVVAEEEVAGGLARARRLASCEEWGEAILGEGDLLDGVE